ncbi:hypothetical protein AX769_01875 [Frondihabitans sp. PAMC 28766]|uniref:glycosyltransferase n=1 Tax=Frondihabitans sp. PAMC 28766 TaxID=1795630 RepID=UPI00078BA016|nr:glycosyltransferase [Frondihabitans sp. PAMC 28766]AMM19112.1 hypothetical protein AX769_01875 [Frondihabitans sp. PAMC 28766]
MRIALVTDYYLPTLGGVQTAVKALAEALATAGHEVTVFCPLVGSEGAQAGTGDAPAAGTAVGVPEIVGLPVSPVFRPDGYPFAWSPRRIRAVLRREFVARGIEVVHTHSEMMAALAAVRTAQDLRIPVVHTMHGRIDVYTANVLPLPAVTTVLLAFLHSRQISHAGLRVDDDAAYTATRTARRMWRLMLAQSRASAHVVVPSQHFARKLRDRGVQTPITVLSNGLEGEVLTAVDAPAARVVGPGEPMRLVWVGRLSPEKRPDVMIRAAHGLSPGVVVDVYGDGVARSAIAKAAASAPVTLHGAVPRSEVLQAMRDAHVLVSSSVDFDNQPMVILEAVAAGLPVLHCDPDLAEVVPDGGGFLTPTPDADGIVAVIERLRRDPAIITVASRAMLSARAAVEQVAGPMIGVYQTALASGPRSTSDPRPPVGGLR